MEQTYKMVYAIKFNKFELFSNLDKKGFYSPAKSIRPSNGYKLQPGHPTTQLSLTTKSSICLDAAKEAKSRERQSLGPAGLDSSSPSAGSTGS